MQQHINIVPEIGEGFADKEEGKSQGRDQKT